MNSTLTPPNRQGRIDAAQVKAMAAGLWPDIIASLTGIPRDHLAGKHHPCLKCGGVDRFRLVDIDAGAVYCNKCFSSRNGDGFAAIMHYCGVDFPTAVRMVAEYLGMSTQGNGTPSGPIDWIGRMAVAKGCPRESLIAYGATVRPGTKAVRFPVYGPDGKQCSEFTVYPAAKPGTRQVKGMLAKGKPSGVFLPHHSSGVVRLPWTGETSLIVEGVKDAAALHGLGFLAIGTNGDNLPQKFAPMLAGCHVVIVPDRTTDAESKALLSASRLAGVASSVHIATLPLPLDGDRGDDTRDALKQKDGEQLVRQCIADAREWTPDQQPQKRERSGPGGDGNEKPSNLAVARLFRDQHIVDDVPALIRHGNRQQQQNFEWNKLVYELANNEDIDAGIAQWMETLCLNPTSSSVASVRKLLQGEIRAPRHVPDDAPIFWRATPPSDFPADADLSTALVMRSRLIMPQAGKPPTEWRSWTRNARLFSTSCYPFDFGPVPPECPRWLKLANELFGAEQDQITALQAWLGYLLSGRTNQQKFLMLSGPPRSGKGTIAYLMERIVGKAWTASTSLPALAGQFGYSALKNKRLAILADERRLGKQATSEVLPKILSVTGEDAVPVDQKYQEPVSIRLGARLAILSNDVSPLVDECPALTSRMLLLRTRESWVGRENVDLKCELEAEIPGILWWAMEGLDWILSGYRMQSPASTADDLAGIQDDGNPLAEFFRERIELAPGEWLATNDIRREAKEWAESQGIEILSNISVKKISQLLASAIPAARRTQRRSNANRAWGYEGIRLRGASYCVTTE